MAESTFSNSNGNCVDVWKDAETGLVCVRDTKLGDQSPVLMYNEDEWLAFTQGVHNNEFEYRNLEVK